MNHLKKVIYNCKQATLLIEKKQLAKLSFRESIELRIHLAGCSMCKLYKKQSHMISTMVLQLYHDSMQQTSTAKLDEAFKKDLQDRIENELNK